MAGIEELRGLVAQLACALGAALDAPGDAAALGSARALATQALELAGGPERRNVGAAPPSWELDTMGESELTLAFVLGSIERASREPERVPHLLRDAHPRVHAILQNLDRLRSS